MDKFWEPGFTEQIVKGLQEKYEYDSKISVKEEKGLRHTYIQIINEENVGPELDLAFIYENFKLYGVKSALEMLVTWYNLKIGKSVI